MSFIKETFIGLLFIFAVFGTWFVPLPAYTLDHVLQENVSQNILMKNYEHIAIATDLEPDDVLALWIIFKEANRQYAESGNYPIDLVIVGEGNVDVKKMRMEALLNYMNIPDGIVIDIVRGKSTSDNIFPYDGEEFFDKKELEKTPFKEHSEVEGMEAIGHFLAKSNHPLIIQLKPAQELLSIPSELTKHATILFYGSFNFRKTVKDEGFQKNENFTHLFNDVEKLEGLLKYFESHFKQIAILESYGILGPQASVYSGYQWTEGIRKKIEVSNDDFMMMFKKLVHNWNRYTLHAQLSKTKFYLHEIMGMLPLAKQNALQNLKLEQIIEEWDENLFSEIYSEAISAIQQIRNEHQNAELMKLADKLERGLKLINQVKPSSGIQFTLSDIGVALALTDPFGCFKSSKVKINVNEYGFIETEDTSESNLWYYNRIDRDKFAQILQEALNQ